MVGRGPVGGCGAEERPCFATCATPGSDNFSITKSKAIPVDVNIFSRKALGQQFPPIVSQNVPGFTTPVSSVVSCFPNRSNGLLIKSNARNRKKKSHVGLDKKRSQAGKPKNGNIWSETEEYFRELAQPDIDELNELSLNMSLESSTCRQIPCIENDNAEGFGFQKNAETFFVRNGNALKDSLNQGNRKMVETDVLKHQHNRHKCLSSGMQWLLGCTNRIILASDQPSRKRKHLGSEAGLEKVVIGFPCEENSSVCDFCCKGELADDSNVLIVCSSCKVGVHCKCYGMQEVVDRSWVCTWCKHKTTSSDLVKQPCVLCPRLGGALKPIDRDCDMPVLEFAHLFCSLWVPDAYVLDLCKMEPIMNVKVNNETQKKLKCQLCKLDSGAYVRCSHGACRTSFHPRCARESRYKLEVWGKYGSDNVELRAFCVKHSESPSPVCVIQNEKPLETVGGNALFPKSYSMMPFKDDYKLKIGLPGDGNLVNREASDCKSDKSEDSKLQEIQLKTFGFGLTPASMSGDAIQFINKGISERGNYLSDYLSDSQCFSMILKKLIDRGKVNVRDVTEDMCISMDSLQSILTEDNFDMQCKIARWLINHVYLGCLHRRTDAKVDLTVLSETQIGASNLSRNVTLEKSSSSNSAPKLDSSLKIKNNTEFSFSNVSSDRISFESKMVMDEIKKVLCEKIENPSQVVFFNGSKEIESNASEFQDSSGPSLFRYQDERVGETFYLEASSSGRASSIDSELNDKACKPVEVAHELFVEAQRLGYLELSPADEVRGEILYCRHKLVGLAVARRQFIDTLICNVPWRLSKEIDEATHKTSDLIIINQYLSKLREEKKVGRREKRHKEAQAVFAAAAASAAASSRVSFRKEAIDDYIHQSMPRKKETDKRVPAPRIKIENYSDTCHSVLDLSKEHSRACDICRRYGRLHNPIIICAKCKVSVHMDCYLCDRHSTGPWYCELCEELLSSKCFGDLSMNSVECALCGCTKGAFKKSTEGHWVHAFCAEWVFGSTFQRGQVNPVEGMETVPKGVDVCSICHQNNGVCLQCSHCKCQDKFHPFCAWRTGFYMSVKSISGRLQHKAYCEKHSSEQRTMVETLGIEELSEVKQIRIELERLRLLCERITKREKLKRDLVLCSHSILASKREHAIHYELFCKPFFPSDISSGSVSTCLLGTTDGCKSSSDAIQQSDDVTVESSTLPVRRRIKVTLSKDANRKTDGSNSMQIVSERVPYAGKKILQSPIDPSNLDGGEWSNLPKKQLETFAKELIMTSDQASIKNKRLPKGYYYVPVDSLPVEDLTHEGHGRW